jgi:uncharacterized protein (TIGR02996 family)
MSGEIYAFLRAILQNLDDEVPRLVFADWLEESGDLNKEIWAKYIRLKWQLRKESPIDDPSLQEELCQVQEQFRYRLHLNAEEFARHLPVLTELIPGKQITLKLGTFNFERMADYIPESVARELQVLPVYLKSNDLWVVIASSIPENQLKRIEYILNKTLLPVRAPRQQIEDAMNQIYCERDIIQTWI